MVSAVAEQHSMVNVIGVALSLVAILTMAELMVPIPICIAPNNAEAVPAFLSKGVSDNADELGKVKPWHARKQNMQMTRPATLNASNIIPIHIITAVLTWHIKAILIICMLVNLRNNRELIWLAMINPIAMMANIHPYCCSVILYNSMNTCGEPAMYAYNPPAAKAPVNAYVANCRFLITNT